MRYVEIRARWATRPDPPTHSTASLSSPCALILALAPHLSCFRRRTLTHLAPLPTGPPRARCAPRPCGGAGHRGRASLAWRGVVRAARRAQLQAGLERSAAHGTEHGAAERGAHRARMGAASAANIALARRLPRAVSSNARAVWGPPNSNSGALSPRSCRALCPCSYAHCHSRQV